MSKRRILEIEDARLVDVERVVAAAVAQALTSVVAPLRREVETLRAELASVRLGTVTRAELRAAYQIKSDYKILKWEGEGRLTPIREGKVIVYDAAEVAALRAHLLSVDALGADAAEQPGV